MTGTSKSKSAESKPSTDNKNVLEHQMEAHFLTVDERAASGKVARSKLPRQQHAAWEPPLDRPDPITLLEAQAKTRLPELIPIRYGRMLASPFAFYRGAAAIMASDLGSMPNTGLRVQLCGDAHLANFGGFASPERDMLFGISDFDETIPGPWEWDVKRLLASIEIAGRERGYSTKQRRSVLLASASEYRRAMREFAGQANLAVWYALLDTAKIQQIWGNASHVKDLRKIEADFSRARTRDNLRAFEKLIHQVGDQMQIVSHPPLIVPIEQLYSQDTDSKAIDGHLREYFIRYRESLADDRHHLLDQYRVVHLARKVVGIGSVGTRTWVALLLGRDAHDPLFLQFKEAQSSVLEPYAGKSRFEYHGKRVVEGQRLMQAVSDIFLGWDRLYDSPQSPPHDFYVRQLWDWKLSADVENMPVDEMAIYCEMCAWSLARAHACSGDRIAISAYLGKGADMDVALADFAIAYADQNQRDYEALVMAVKNGRIKAETGI